MRCLSATTSVLVYKITTSESGTATKRFHGQPPQFFLTTSLRLGGGFGVGVVAGGSGVGVVAGGDGGSGGSDSIAPAHKFWSEIAPNFFSDSLISGLMNFTTDDKKRHLVKKHIYNQDRFCYRKIFFLVPVPDELFYEMCAL